MAKAALEMAVLDAELRASGQSFGERLGATREAVDCGVSIGIFPTIKELIVQVDGYLDEGYKRIKLKIEPGWDYEPVRAGARALARHPPSGRREHGVLACRGARRRARRPSTSSTSCSSSSPCPKTT